MCPAGDSQRRCLASRAWRSAACRALPTGLLDALRWAAAMGHGAGSAGAGSAGGRLLTSLPSPAPPAPAPRPPRTPRHPCTHPALCCHAESVRNRHTAGLRRPGGWLRCGATLPHPRALQAATQRCHQRRWWSGPKQVSQGSFERDVPLGLLQLHDYGQHQLHTHTQPGRSTGYAAAARGGLECASLQPGCGLPPSLWAPTCGLPPSLWAA